jgi:tetratricopeptide (TPR) repeat protein
VREALTVLEPLLENPSGDPAVDARALFAHALALTVVDRLDDALAYAEQAVEIASDPMTRALALGERSIVLTYCGEHDAAVRDSEESAAIAKTLGPAALSGALLFAAQAHLFAGDLSRAAEQLAEAERVGAPADASKIRAADTLRGDIAMASGRPGDSLEYYAKSLEGAQAREEHLQVLFDLLGIATALARLRDDTGALEVAGLAAAQGADIGGPAANIITHMLGDDALTAADARAGSVRSAELKARGRAVPAADRVARACQLARLRQLV